MYSLYTEFDHDDHYMMEKMLLGRRIVAADEDTLTLDDGGKLEVLGNDGCGGCPAGNYDVTAVADFPNAITSVEVQRGKREGGGIVYRLFVYAVGLTPGEVVTVEGSDGNGYYGTGFSIRVISPSASRS